MEHILDMDVFIFQTERKMSFLFVDITIDILIDILIYLLGP